MNGGEFRRFLARARVVLTTDEYEKLVMIWAESWDTAKRYHREQARWAALYLVHAARLARVNDPAMVAFLHRLAELCESTYEGNTEWRNRCAELDRSLELAARGE